MGLNDVFGEDVFGKYDANSDWNRARRKALYQDVVCHFKTCSIDLLSFEDVRRQLHLTQRIDRGVREIALDQIRGSVGRYDDFTAAFLPRKGHLQERWKQVDLAMRAGGTPPIEVYQVGDSYFVLDGNHRVSIAKQQGAQRIEAYVWEYPMSSQLDPDADINAVLLEGEHRAFLQKFGDARPEVREIAFTSPDRYSDLDGMIERYLHDLETESGATATPAQAASAWYEDAYAPAVEKIRQQELLAMFPGRTEADLFIWAWQNNQDMEEMAQIEGIPPAAQG